MKNKKIIVGLSGGVDSSVALVLLKEQGWSPIGVSLELPVWKGRQRSLSVARKICQKLKVPYHLFGTGPEFQKKVVDYFISELKNNKTPNPCLICNRQLKFKKLFEFAKKVGADHVATGHYARTSKNHKTGKWELLKGRDKTKDQSYALCFLPQKWLSRLVFPLGDLTKKEVCRLAKKQGFGFLAKQRQSQDFCFLAGRSLPAFLKKEIGLNPGKVFDSRGNYLGEHRGLHFCTIGQRKGLGFSGGPWFVKNFDLEKNILVVSKNPREGSQRELILSPFHFINSRLPKKKIRVMAKIRYRHRLAKATLFPPAKNKLKLVFDQPQKAVTPGQFAVFYQKEVCLGAGRIS